MKVGKKRTVSNRPVTNFVEQEIIVAMLIVLIFHFIYVDKSVQFFRSCPLLTFYSQSEFIIKYRRLINDELLFLSFATKRSFNSTVKFNKLTFIPCCFHARIFYFMKKKLILSPLDIFMQLP